jgi:twitching motility protein PilT
MSSSGISTTETDEIEVETSLEENGSVQPPPRKRRKRRQHRHRIDKYFRAAVKMKASDLHMKSDNPPRYRVGGKLRVAKAEALSNEEIEDLIFEILTPRQKERYTERGSEDFAYALTDDDRFRINVFRQRGLTSMAARRINKDILGYADLHLPPSIGRLASLHQGLILLSGITGSGKSTTIAAMIEEINRTRACHIVTIEDPIEYLYADKKAFINQREIGIDVHSFHDALKYLMREDPDVVLIGEMRDAETFSAAIQAAESGHLCFGTIHASGTAGTITRILELFPEETRDLVRTSLAMNLQGVVCQKLLPSIKKGVPRVPTVEIMLANPSIRKLILEEREGEIKTVIQNSYNDGMIDFSEHLRQLVDDEYVTPAVAYDAAPNPDELRMKLKGIEISKGGLVG